MAEIALVVQPRTEVGKNAAKKLRRQGLVPGVVYGPGREPVPVSVSDRDLMRVARIAGYTKLIDLDIAGDKRVVLIKELANDPIKDSVIHVDFQEVRMDREIQTLVPIVFVGEDKRESDGGIISAGLRELAIRCLPSAIPDAIEVDISGMKIGDTLLVSDLSLPEGVICEDDPEEVVVSITVPDTVADEEETEAGEAEAVDETGESSVLD